MKLMHHIVVCILALLPASVLHAQNQYKPEDVYKQAEEEADRLQRVLDLEDWQTFYVDSTLKHDLTAMLKEYEDLKASKVSNASIYMAVHDTWMDKIDETYKKLFTPEQWAAYLKSGAAREQKARARRKAQAK